MTDFSVSSNNPFSHVKDNHEKNVAFVIHRNNNSNVVVYAANLADSGEITSDNPMNVYWIMFEKKGTPTEGLNMIERNTAYGSSVKPHPSTPGHFEVSLASIKDRKLDLFVENGKVVAKTVINQVDGCILERVFVSSKSTWTGPSVEYIELFGFDAQGNAVVEKKIP